LSDVVEVAGIQSSNDPSSCVFVVVTHLK